MISVSIEELPWPPIEFHGLVCTLVQERVDPALKAYGESGENAFVHADAKTNAGSALRKQIRVAQQFTVYCIHWTTSSKLAAQATGAKARRRSQGCAP